MRNIQVLFSFGVSKVLTYELYVTPRLGKVLSMYASRGLLGVRKMRLPGNQPNKRGGQHKFFVGNVRAQTQNEIVLYHDCFYRLVLALDG